MRKDLENIKLIEEYLSGQLSPEHKAEFEKRLKEEKNIQNEVALTKKVIEGIEGFGFKNMLKEFHQKNFGKE